MGGVCGPPCLAPGFKGSTPGPTTGGHGGKGEGQKIEMKEEGKVSSVEEEKVNHVPGQKIMEY